jgi:hypothetical protein
MIKKYIKILILLVAGTIVFSTVFVVGVLYTTIKHLIKLDYSFNKQFFPILTSITLIFDGLANAGAGEMFNDTMLRRKKNKELYKETYKYGKWHDTISEVTGINEKRGVLSKAGLRFTALLSFVLGHDHSIEAINKDRLYKPNGQEKK